MALVSGNLLPGSGYQALPIVDAINGKVAFYTCSNEGKCSYSAGGTQTATFKSFNSENGFHVHRFSAELAHSGAPIFVYDAANGIQQSIGLICIHSADNEVNENVCANLSYWLK